jgi:hypothetical protein
MDGGLAGGISGGDGGLFVLVAWNCSSGILLRMQ